MAGERLVTPEIKAEPGSLTGALLLLGACYGAILLTGTREQGALGLFLVIAGIVLIVSKPRAQLSGWIWTLGAAFLGTAALSLLPLEWNGPPEWRARWQVAEEMPVSSTITPVALETAWWWSLLAITLSIGFLLLARPLRSREQLILANAAIFLTALYAALAIFCELTGYRFPFDALPTFGFFRNPNHTASLCVIGAVLALSVLGLSPQCGHRSSRWLASSALLFCAAALIFFSSSRGGIVFLATGTALWLAGLGRHHRMQAHYLAIAGTLLAGLLIFLLSGGNARQRVLGSVGLDEGVSADAAPLPAGEPWDFRLLIFQDTWRIIQDHPWTGTGLGTFASIFPQYQQASLRASTAAHPESDWLMLMAEAGLPCTAMLVALLVVTCWSFRHAQAHPYWPLRWGMFCAAATAALHGLVDVPIHRIPLGWWVLLLGASSIRRKRETPDSGWASRCAFVFAGIAAVFMGVSLVRAEWFQGTPAAPFHGEVTQQTVAAHISRNEIERAIAAAETGIDRAPTSGGLYFQLGALSLATGDALEDVDHFFLAQRLLQPRWPEIPFQQGLAWLNSDASRCVTLWREAVTRQQAIDMRTGRNDSASLYRRILHEATGNPEVQRRLLDSEATNGLNAIWFETVPRDLVDYGLHSLGRNTTYLAQLGSAERERLVQLWAMRGNAAELERFLNDTPGWDEFAWLLRLRHALDQRAFEDAVRLVAAEHRISLALPQRKTPMGDPSSADPVAKFVNLWSRGKEITARNVLSTAVQAGRIPPEVYRWRAALAAHEGNWLIAWQELEKYVRGTGRVIW